MPTFAQPLTSANKTSPQGFLRVFNQVFTQSGVTNPNALKVSAQLTPDMSVVVSGSALDDLAVFKHADGTFVQAWNTENKTIAIPSNNSGVTKTDAIVFYVDMTEGSIEDANNPDALKFVVVRRDGVATGEPTSGEIEAVTGTNPYFVKATVTVASGATEINSGNVVNKTVLAQLSKEMIEPLGEDQLEDEAVTPEKRSGGFKMGVIPASTFGTSGNKQITGVGFKPKRVKFTVVYPNAANFASWAEGSMYEDGSQAAGGLSVAKSGPDTGRAYSTSRCILAVSSSDGSSSLSAEYVSMDSDGFTINVTTISTFFDVVYEAEA